MRYTTRIIVPPRVRRSGLPGSPGAGPRPQALGVRKSFGFGDRLGVAGAGHVAVAAAHPDFVGFFAQQSAAEMADAGRTPADVLAAAARAVGHARHRQPWGADADRLRSPQEVHDAAGAGFTYFTIDLSEHVRDADRLSPDELAAASERAVADGEMPDDWCAPYLDRTIDLSGGQHLRLTIEPLRRAAVKFGRAIQHAARMAEAVARANHGRPYEIEVSLDGSAAVTPAEHLFLGLELEARGVRLTGLELRLEDAGAERFEETLREHAAVASFCGPYKLCFRAGAHAPALDPVIGRCCGDALHVKTAGESYLELLRLAWRCEPALFREIIRFAHAEARSEAVPENHADDAESRFLDEPASARLLDTTCGAVLRDGREEGGRSFKTALVELAGRHADIYQELLFTRFDRKLQALNAG